MLALHFLWSHTGLNSTTQYYICFKNKTKPQKKTSQQVYRDLSVTKISTRGNHDHVSKRAGKIVFMFTQCGDQEWFANRRMHVPRFYCFLFVQYTAAYFVGGYWSCLQNYVLYCSNMVKNAAAPEHISGHTYTRVSLCFYSGVDLLAVEHVSKMYECSPDILFLLRGSPLTSKVYVPGISQECSFQPSFSTQEHFYIILGLPFIRSSDEDYIPRKFCTLNCITEF